MDHSSAGSTEPVAVQPASDKLRVTSRAERVSYNSFWFGQNLLYMVVTTFLAVFYTSSLGIPAAVVGTILLAARLWDAVVDPLLATLIERTKLKRGKFKPWIMAAAITVPVMTVLCFGYGGDLAAQSLTVRIAYASVTYFLWGTIYAASDGPAYALSTVMTPHLSERNTMLTNNQFTSMLGLLTAVIAMPAILSATGDNYFLAAGACALVSLLTMIPIQRVKERIVIPRETPRIRDIWHSVVTNRYLVITVVIGFIVYGTDFGITLAAFLSSDIYGGAGDTSILLITKILPILIIAPLGARLIRRFGKVKLLAFSLIATAVLSVLAWAVSRDSFTLLAILSLIRGFAFAPQIFMFSILFSDSIEYSYYTKGKRFEAATFATQTMMVKAGTAVAGGIAMWAVGLAGYRESVAGEVVVQSAGALNAMWALYHLASAVGSIVACIILLRAYDLTEPRLQEMAVANREKEQAES